ncbi:MAG: sigma 54-interacting transcriptional regulator [Gammaproteobacteria bacterium]|nr:sigma 54-interacting transcriptional regulator [Gammaproteobacteria bacterium]MDH5629105.1 sigma 54-interacting transcriptional regulator [Gammaproteobacteria bacterium]
MTKLEYSNKSIPKVLIIGYQEFSRLVSSNLAHFKDVADFKIVDIIIGSSTDVLKHIEEYQPDVVVSAGSNAAYLKSFLDIPVVSLEVSESDIAQSISKAAKISSDILLICFEKPQSILPHLEKSLGVKITCEAYHTPEEAREIFYLETNKSSKAIVGASFVCGLATKSGLKSFLYYSHDSTIKTIQSAIDIGRAYARSKYNNTLASWILNQSVSPVIIVHENELVSINSSAISAFELDGINDKDIVNLLNQNLNFDIFSHNGSHWKVSRQKLALPDFNQSIIYQFFEISNSSLQAPSTQSVKYNMIYQSDIMANMMEKIKRFAISPSNVLITGESGTGKELAARTIHKQSPYAKGNFVAINCSAIPSELFEGELFGYVDGAYTGAKRGGRKGLIENASHGVLFLDEVSDLTLDQQAKLLRFIQERIIRPLGSNKEIPVDLKIVAATNVSLSDMVIEKKFREDLLFRLNIFSIELPPLRFRKEDIKAISLSKLQAFFQTYNLNLHIDTILNQLIPVFNEYAWPGNVRELENVLERLSAHLTNTTDENSVQDLIREIAPELFLMNQNKGGSLQQKELNTIADAMKKFGNDKRKVADYLGISHTTLWRRLKQLNN